MDSPESPAGERASGPDAAADARGCCTRARATTTSSGRFFVGPAFDQRMPAIMRRHIYTGAMGSTYMTLITGMFVAAYGRELGISYFAWGVLAALSSFVVGFQLLSARLTAKSGHRRSLWFACSMSCRLCKGLAIVSAYYLSGRSATFASVAFVALTALGNAFASLAAPPWFSWLADLVPAEQHGRFMGRRSSWIALTVVLVLVPAAWFIDEWSRVGLGVSAMMIVFALGLGLGYVDLIIHNTIPEPVMKPERVRSFGQQVMTVLGDRAFRPWLVFRSAWNFSMTLGGSMMVFYFLENLGFRGRLVAGVVFITAVPLVGQVFGAQHMGAVVDRLGTRAVIRAGHLVWALVPLFWFFVTKETSLWILVVWQLISGIASNAAENAGTKLITRLPRREDCAMYMAVSSCVVGIAAGLGSFAAGTLLDLLEGFEWQIGGMALVGFHVLYLVSTVLRLLSTVLTWWLPDRAIEEERIDAAKHAA